MHSGTVIPGGTGHPLAVLALDEPEALPAEEARRIAQQFADIMTKAGFGDRIIVAASIRCPGRIRHRTDADRSVGVPRPNYDPGFRERRVRSPPALARHGARRNTEGGDLMSWITKVAAQSGVRRPPEGAGRNRFAERFRTSGAWWRSRGGGGFGGRGFGGTPRAA